MTSPTWFFDGDLRVAYEVPPNSTFTVDGNGYRIYTPVNPLTAPAVLTVDVKKDLWSRWVDWYSTALWSIEAFSRSGGTLRPTGEYAPADFQLMTSFGWRLVLANYPHETIFYGNLFPEGSDSLFDNSRLSVVGVVPRLQGSANLLTYNYATSGNQYTLSEIGAAVRLELAPELDHIQTLQNGMGLDSTQAQMLLEIYRLYGLDPTKPLVVTNTSRVAGAEIVQTINSNDSQTVITRT